MVAYYLRVVVGLVYHFFFQAEDGIRDRNVTGVQTCALPICPQALVDQLHPGPNGRTLLVELCRQQRQVLVALFAQELEETLLELRQTVRLEALQQIGRASCRKECRAGVSPKQQKKIGTDEER